MKVQKQIKIALKSPVENLPNLEAVFIWVSNLMNETIENLEDGKVNLAESIGYLDNAFALRDIAPRLLSLRGEFEKIKDHRAYVQALNNKHFGGKRHAVQIVSEVVQWLFHTAIFADNMNMIITQIRSAKLESK